MRIIYTGESHMNGVAAVIEGFPAGFAVDEERINRDLARRQSGYGRGKRMAIESDRIKFFSGIIDGKTIGAPITLIIPNRDNRRDKWGQFEPRSIPRPGHADLAGCIKYEFDDTRLVAERASARHTASWVAAGSLMAQFLEKFGIELIGYVENIGGIEITPPPDPFEHREEIEKSPFRIHSKEKEDKLIEIIDNARESGETLGGIIRVAAKGVPAGLGSYVHPDRRLDARLAMSFMGIPSVKSFEIGDGINLAFKPGSQAVDHILSENGKIYHETNMAGGIEGGVSNGEFITVRAGFKPIPTTGKGLPSVDLKTGKYAKAPYVRSDITVAPAISVIGESMTATVLAEAFLERFGGDTFNTVMKRFRK